MTPSSSSLERAFAQARFAVQTTKLRRFELACEMRICVCRNWAEAAPTFPAGEHLRLQETNPKTHRLPALGNNAT